jgi:3-deoxy-D-manno-octulosonic-acid transferase
MFRTIYNLLFAGFFALAAPFYFLKLWRRGQWQRGFGERFGKFGAKVKQSVTNSHVVWLHAVSVGEVNICTHLIQGLMSRLPNAKFVVSTTTTTGMAELEKKLPGHVTRIYYPIDLRGAVSKAFRVLHPEVIILVEAEIWPNFLWRAQDSETPVFLVNARLSERSYRRYRWAGFLFRPLFHSFAGISVQDPADAQRVRQLGARDSAIQVVGNLKFDAARIDARPGFDVEALLRSIGVDPAHPILVAGSTHAGEELILARMTRRLRQRFPGLFLIIVPRHFERGKEVGEMLTREKVRFLYRTQVSPAKHVAPGELECLLVNTTGELRSFYQVATAIFVGKSLTAEGGQNPIEPGALGKAMVFGPNMQNFRSIAETFVRESAALQIQDEEELEAAVASLLANPEKRATLGANALKVVQANQGSVDRTVEMVVRALEGTPLYVAPPGGPKPAFPSARTKKPLESAASERRSSRRRGNSVEK